MDRTNFARGLASSALLVAVVLASAGCGGGATSDAGSGSTGSPSGGGTPGGTSGGGGTPGSGTPGNAASTSCAVPAAWDIAALPHATVGNGTPQSCTRAALAGAVARGGYIAFDCGSAPATIAIDAQVPVASGKITVVDGGGKVVLDGGGTSRIFQVANGNALSVRGLALNNGYSMPASPGDDLTQISGGAIRGGYRSKLEVIEASFTANKSSGGGAIYLGSDADLTVVRSSFSNNSSWYGGAILDYQSGLKIVDSSFTGNSAAKTSSGDAGWGGAVATDGSTLASLTKGGVGSGGLLSVCGSSFTGNSSATGGGGVWLWAYAPDTIVVANSTFARNTTQGIGGAARLSIGFTDFSHQGSTMTTPGNLTVTGSSFLSNTSQGNGGALYMDCYGPCKVANSSFFGNDSKGVGGAIQHVGWAADVGGNQPTTVQFNNVTFADNTNAHSVLFGSRFALNNTVLATHTAQRMCSDASSSGAHLLQYSSVGATASCLSSGTVLTGDPLLGAPADHGGPTLTMMPAAASPLRGAGAGCEPLDQRGQPRSTATCDIGAVEGS